MMKDYLGQTIVLKRKTGVNENNESTYTQTTTKGRFEYNTRGERTAAGEHITCDGTLFTLDSINVDDVIVFDGRNWTVAVVKRYICLLGDTDGYECDLA